MTIDALIQSIIDHPVTQEMLVLHFLDLGRELIAELIADAQAAGVDATPAIECTLDPTPARITSLRAWLMQLPHKLAWASRNGHRPQAPAGMTRTVGGIKLRLNGNILSRDDRPEPVRLSRLQESVVCALMSRNTAVPARAQPP